MKKAIILANGDTPKKSQIKYLQKIGYSTIVCADGGANSAKKLNIIPDYIIGDLDSIRKKNLNFFEKKSKIIHFKRQNDTDVEKSLKFIIKKKYDEVLLLGSTGDRLDHTICNLGIVIKYFEKIKISILHGNSFLRAYNKDVEIKTILNEIISIYGFDKKTKIKSNGLKYPLKNVTLPFGESESTSNVAVKNKLKIKIKGGIFFIIRDYKTMRDNDFI
ncbi:MAG: thiamine diphosphokinase [Ignavibacteriae bacterium]|nr:thiamine diphosphokinase [Ignavibacteriota bacterium]